MIKEEVDGEETIMKTYYLSLKGEGKKRTYITIISSYLDPILCNSL